MNHTFDDLLTYSIEGFPYPRCILGSDRFLDWFPHKPPLHHLTADYVYKMMKCVYNLGIRGFDLPVRQNVIEAFRKLKKDYPNAIGIGNPNWLCGYKLNGIDLMELKDRVIRTVYERYLNSEQRSKVESMPPKSRKQRFYFDASSKPLEPDEINQIYINEEIWLDRLDSIEELAKFCLVGADYADWMYMLNRRDLIRWQISKVRERGLIPISSGHWTSLSLPLLDLEDFAAHWVVANREWMYLDFDTAIDAVKKAKKPITAFRILRGIKLPDEIPAAVQWLKQTVGVSSTVVGLDDERQASVTVPIVVSIMCR